MGRTGTDERIRYRVIRRGSALTTVMLLLLFALLTGKGLAAGGGVRINAAEVLYDEVRDEIRAAGGVEVHWDEGMLTTEEAIFLIGTSELFVPGPVSARFGEHLVSGEGLYYNFAARSGWFKHSQLLYRMTDTGNLYFRGARIEVSKDQWWGEDLLVTGCKKERPFYSVRAQRVTIYPQERLVIEGLGLYIRDTRVFWIPTWSRTLGVGGARLLPQVGYEQSRGYFIDFSYQYHLTNELLLQAQLDLATRQDTRLGVDISAAFPNLEARVFYDYWQEDESSYGGYVRFMNDSLSLGLLTYENERIGEERLSRSPQFFISYRHEFAGDFYIRGAASIGHFTTSAVSAWREDFFFLAGWSGEGYGGEAFYQTIGLTDLPGARVLGGTVWAEKAFTEDFSAGIRYRLANVDGETFFFFDPQDTSELQLDLTYGDLDRSFLRFRGHYDFLTGDFARITAGIGLGIDDYSLGVEGVYSFADDDWQSSRYFIRHKIEECVMVEASWWEPDRTFFLSVELIGFDQEGLPETLFDEADEFDQFAVER
ncbi:MAG TPA: hypothetical protein VLH40_04015 [Atribacteraceae bacterium]|nr:hypothetical protein [Atribacteraceae bacterium]